MEKIRISVRELVEFILRSGDIDNRHGGPADREAMLEGGRLHRRIQGRMGSSYKAEVPLSKEILFDDFVLTVEGRADGIITGKEVYIDEIKGVYRDLRHLEKPVEVHLAQAKCYAHIYASAHGLSRIGVQMTYSNLIREDDKRFKEMYDAEELARWFEELVGAYEKWVRYQLEWKKIRQASCKEAEFPFPWRQGQKKLSQDVYRTILRRKKLFIQAPTGTGKTISTVFPAVKAVGEGIADRIFYMTAKTITRTVAEEAFGMLRERGLRMKVLTLTSKERICFCEETECNPDYCPYAKGHFDRINDAVYEMITGTDVFDREAVIRQAQKWMVCPFEFSLDLSLWVDVVICDYNYVFSPRVKLKRFFAEGVKGDYLFLIDEAHNLVERGRDMFSAELYKESFLELRKTVKPYSRKIAYALEKCNRYLLELKRKMEKENPGKEISVNRDRKMKIEFRRNNEEETEEEIKGENRGRKDGSGKKEAKTDKSEETKQNGSVYIQTGETVCRIQEGVGTFPTHLINLCGAIEDYLEKLRQEKKPVLVNTEVSKKILDFYFQILAFLDICDRLDKNYVVYTELCEDKRFMIKLYCVDVSRNLQECLDKGKSTVYFSATLLPITYYKSLLSTLKDDYAIYAQSSFDPGKRKVLIGADTSSRYENRSEAEYRKMARYVLEMVRAKEGNYMVFFSSYQMLEDVADALAGICEEEGIGLMGGGGDGEETGRTEERTEEKREIVETERAEEQTEENWKNGEIVRDETGQEKKQDGSRKEDNENCEIESCRIEMLRQTTDMDEKARERFLEKFSADRTGSLVGFCVMGGIFGEGIDLKNDRLIGAVIVGTGIPKVCNEREILRKFYDDRKENGFFYAYTCPGMNKVLQSAGRVIRTDEDEGVILLLDRRFAQERYRQMFPEEWRQPQICSVKNVRERIEEFWKN